MRNHFNLQMKNNSDANNPHSPPQQLDVFSPNAGKFKMHNWQVNQLMVAIPAFIPKLCRFTSLPFVGLLSQAQREAVGAAETDLGQELGNGQDDLDEREFEPYEIEKRDSQGHNSRKWFSSCPRWRAKSRPNNQV